MGRKPRDPLAPRRALPAFHFYAETRKAAVKKKHPSLAPLELTKKLADEWRDLDQDEREPFREKAKADRQRHNSEKADYVPVDTSVVGLSKSGKRLKKDPARPKKPLTSYIAFMTDMRPKMARLYPGSGVKELAPKLSAEWSGLSDAKRKKYTDQADADRLRFEREMAKYKPSKEYLEAKAAFKASVRGGGPGKSADADDDDVVEVPAPGELAPAKENALLKRALEQQQAALAKAQADLADLETFDKLHSLKTRNPQQQAALDAVLQKGWAVNCSKAGASHARPAALATPRRPRPHAETTCRRDRALRAH